MTTFNEYDEVAAIEKEIDNADPLDDLIADAFDETGQYVPPEERQWLSAGDEDSDSLDAWEAEDAGGPAPLAFSSLGELNEWFETLSEGEQIDWINGLSQEQVQEIFQAEQRARVDAQMGPLLESQAATLERLQAERVQRAQAREQEALWHRSAQAEKYEEVAHAAAAEAARAARTPNADTDALIGQAGRLVRARLAEYRAAGFSEAETVQAMEQESFAEVAMAEAAETVRVRSITQKVFGAGPFNGSWVRPAGW